MRMRGWVAAALEYAELFVTSVIHTLFGISMISTGMACQFSNVFNQIFKRSPSIKVAMRESKRENEDADLPPVVLVHGLFGFGKGKMGGLSYFGGAEKMHQRALVPDLGSLTSVHDRARELFYYLKGGRVDYGEEHSKVAGHSQFGKVYEQGHYPEWDEDHPIHLVAHSAGAQVIRVLQQMLADKAFEGHESTSENWVISITTIAGAINGCTRTYLDGMMLEDWRSLRPISLLGICSMGMIICDWLDIAWLKNFYNFGFDHFNLSWRKIGFSGLADCLLGNSGPFASGDWVLPDLTIRGSIRTNSRIKTFPATFYFSYAGKKTRKSLGVTVPSRMLEIHPLFWFRTWQMCRWRYPKEAELPYKGYRDEDWQDNDGVLNTISMTHPRLPIEHPSQFVANDHECPPLKPGIWYYRILEADHMLFVLNRGRAGVQFDMMYDSIFERCRKQAFGIKSGSTLLPNLNNKSV